MSRVFLLTWFLLSAGLVVAAPPRSGSGFGGGRAAGGFAFSRGAVRGTAGISTGTSTTGSTTSAASSSGQSSGTTGTTGGCMSGSSSTSGGTSTSTTGSTTTMGVTIAGSTINSSLALRSRFASTSNSGSTAYPQAIWPANSMARPAALSPPAASASRITPTNADPAAASPSLDAPSRNWVIASDSGDTTLDAQFVAVLDNQVVLRPADGHLRLVASDQLSPADQQYVSGQTAHKPGPEIAVRN
jgi:hypothetical protein